jgi:hypothetical protein
LALTIAGACQSTKDLEIREDLRKRSASDGVALVTSRGSDIAVIPFDGEERYYHSDSREYRVYGKFGRSVLWMYRTGFFSAVQFGIETIGGEPAQPSRAPTSEFVPIALSESGHRLAYRGVVPRNGRSKGLVWASYDFSESGLVDEAGGACDWSPDGNALVYERRGEIYIFGVQSGSSRRVTAGHDPTWSPDGKLIAFRGDNDKATLISPEGVRKEWAIAARTANSAVRWSPDGLYVSFAEPVKNSVPLIGTYSRLVVCRIADGQAIGVRDFGAGAGDTGNYFWIVDYRRYCLTCTPGEPFS